MSNEKDRRRNPGWNNPPREGRGVSYEEERRRRERPWSPSESLEQETRSKNAVGRHTPQGTYQRESATPDNRGKGPKGYVRSDERIREQICEAMTEDAALDASDVEVSVENGEVTLSGSVADRNAKRRAEDLSYDCFGVRDVQNNIRVGAR